MKLKMLNSKFRRLSNGMTIPLLRSGYGREAVTNDEPREDAICNSEIGSTDEEGWVKIATYGVHPGSVKGRDQHFFEEDANAVVAEFNSLRGQLGRMFRGIPIYIGHPDTRPDLYTDHRRLGRYTDLQTRADGLWAKEELNSLGMENKREGYWMYPSPRWDAPAGRPRFRPTRLISVGLTNSPRLLGSEPVANSTLDAETKEETKTNTIMDRKLLCEKLGLDVTATDEEILAKIETLNSAAADAEAKLTVKAGEMETVKTEKDEMANSITTLTGRVTALEGELRTERETVANGLLDAAVKDGRITQADRASWHTRLTGDKREEEANALAGLKPAMNTKSIDVAKSRVEIGDEKGRRETIANAVDAIMKEKGVGYDDAWLLAKKDPALKPVWDAMRSEG
jgi:Mu-like prophage I protein